MTVKEIRQDIIDNSNGSNMGDILNSVIANTDTFDVSTGYFDVGGYDVLRKTLEQKVTDTKFHMRLLMGKEAILTDKDSFEKYAIEYGQDVEDSLSLKSSIDETELTPDSRRGIIGLINLLKSDNVEVKMSKKRFNHSKCYITKSAAFIGSSNFTAAGMAGNYELNVGIYSPLLVDHTRDWFDSMWKLGKDTKKELLNTLLQSKFGAPATPYEIYMKILFERFRPLLARDDDAETTSYGSTLTKFQQDAVRTAMSIISEHGGVIIADATGLGKTNMGLEIVRQKVLKEGKKVLLIAPAQVLHSMWSEKLKDVGANVRETISMEALGREDILIQLKKFKNIDFVLIDESQNFRSKNANRRNNLMKLMTLGRPKQAVLLTATPINNSIMDLYYQLSIITLEQDDYFARTIGIPNLYKHMTSAANKEGGLQQGLEKIEQLLDMVMVRRTRSFIKDVYKDDKINGKQIEFPTHKYSPIRYSLSKYYGNVFKEILDGINSLNMTPYRMEWYNENLKLDEKDMYENKAHLQVIVLLKRFESSTEAVRISIENKIKLYEYVAKILKEGKILRAGDFNSIMAKWRSQELDGDGDENKQTEFFLEQIKAIETEPIGKKYNIKLINEHLVQDLEMLKLLLRKVKGVKRDKKLDSVIDSLQEDGALKRRKDMSGKVLIFSEYAATVRYITKILNDEFDGKTVDCITGDTKPEKRMEIIKRFSPKSNQTDSDVVEGKDIDILVSTEVLAEGQNLQDCNYVINYDLPWNPMRIVQRTGRIDRLASTFKVIHTRACFPDEELDKILKLVGKVIGKIKTANETVGLDGELLGETPNKKQYNGTIMGRIKVLSKSGEGTNGLIEDLEREADIMPQTTPMSEISRYVKEKGMELMQEIPMGRRTGKKEEKGDRAILAYLQEKPNRRIYFVRYDFRTQKTDVPDDEFDAIRDIRCAVNTPTHLPMDNVDHQKSFELLLQIDKESRIAIREKNDYVTEYAKKVKSGNVSNEFSKVTDEIKNVIVDAENISIDDGETVDLILDSGYAKPWTDKLKGFFTDYKRDKNIDALIFKIKELGKDIGVEKSKKIKDVEIQQGEPDLKIVGAMLITGKKFDVVSFNNLYTHMNT